MQTFLPYSDFSKTAKCLDNKRLGKQRVEAYQLLLLMCEPDRKGWRNHPAFKMWNGYDISLIEYGLSICFEWKRRGYKDSLEEKFENILMNSLPYRNKLSPSWLGNDNFHASHRSALLYKNYPWYSQFEWTESPEYNYVWPV